MVAMSTIINIYTTSLYMIKDKYRIIGTTGRKKSGGVMQLRHKLYTV